MQEPSAFARATAFNILTRHPDCLKDDVVMNELIDDVAKAIDAGRPGFDCKAQPTADPPQDCDWPWCGCDPQAARVLDHMQECDLKIVRMKNPVAI